MWTVDLVRNQWRHHQNDLVFINYSSFSISFATEESMICGCDQKDKRMNEMLVSEICCVHQHLRYTTSEQSSSGEIIDQHVGHGPCWSSYPYDNIIGSSRTSDSTTIPMVEIQVGIQRLESFLAISKVVHSSLETYRDCRKLATR
jgi:hypothetical protein